MKIFRRFDPSNTPPQSPTQVQLFTQSLKIEIPEGFCTIPWRNPKSRCVPKCPHSRKIQRRIDQEHLKKVNKFRVQDVIESPVVKETKSGQASWEQNVIIAPPGSGKTQLAIKEMIFITQTIKQNCIYSAPNISLLEATKKRLLEKDPNALIRCVHSKNSKELDALGNPKKAPSIRKQLEEINKELHPDMGMILLITHEGLVEAHRTLNHKSSFDVYQDEALAIQLHYHNTCESEYSIKLFSEHLKELELGRFIKDDGLIKVSMNDQERKDFQEKHADYIQKLKEDKKKCENTPSYNKDGGVDWFSAFRNSILTFIFNPSVLCMESKVLKSLESGEPTRFSLIVLKSPELYAGYNAVKILSATFKHTPNYKIWNALGVQFNDITENYKSELRDNPHTSPGILLSYAMPLTLQTKTAQVNGLDLGTQLKKVGLETIPLLREDLGFNTDFRRSDSIVVWDNIEGQKKSCESIIVTDQGTTLVKNLSFDSGGSNDYVGFHNIILEAALNDTPEVVELYKRLGVDYDHSQHAFDQIFQAATRIAIRDPDNKIPVIILTPEDIVEMFQQALPHFEVRYLEKESLRLDAPSAESYNNSIKLWKEHQEKKEQEKKDRLERKEQEKKDWLEKKAQKKKDRIERKEQEKKNSQELRIKMWKQRSKMVQQEKARHAREEIKRQERAAKYRLKIKHLSVKTFRAKMEEYNKKEKEKLDAKHTQRMNEISKKFPKMRNPHSTHPDTIETVFTTPKEELEVLEDGDKDVGEDGGDNVEEDVDVDDGDGDGDGEDVDFSPLNSDNGDGEDFNPFHNHFHIDDGDVGDVGEGGNGDFDDVEEDGDDGDDFSPLNSDYGDSCLKNTNKNFEDPSLLNSGQVEKNDHKKDGEDFNPFHIDKVNPPTLVLKRIDPDHQISLTFFNNVREFNPLNSRLTLDEFLLFIQQRLETPIQFKEGVVMAPYTLLGDADSRQASNIQAMTGLFLDFDTPEEEHIVTLEMVKEATGITPLCSYGTFSGGHRRRMFIPYRQPISTDNHLKFAEMIQQRLLKRLQRCGLDVSTLKPTSVFFIPGSSKNPGSSVYEEGSKEIINPLLYINTIPMKSQPVLKLFNQPRRRFFVNSFDEKVLPLLNQMSPHNRFGTAQKAVGVCKACCPEMKVVLFNQFRVRGLSESHQRDMMNLWNKPFSAGLQQVA